MGKRQPAGASTGGKPPQGSKTGGSSGSAPAGAKKNPFDFFRHKPKHDVANARTRNVNVAKSRSQAIEKRMGTIGIELAQRHRTGTLVDRRFGENDASISKEDKMLIRFQRTRQKQLVNEKRQMFNLNSDDDEDDEEEALLTHHGRTVDEMYASAPKVVLTDEEVSDDGSEDSFDAAKREGGSKVDFGGMTLKSRSTMELDDDGDPNPDFLKSKAEVMSELISKSKAHRYEKQKELSERKDQVDALDECFEELRELLGIEKHQVRAIKKQQQKDLSAMPQDDEGSDIEADDSDSFDHHMSSSESESESGSSIDENDENQNSMDVDDDFDKMVKRLSAPGVRRAKPSNALLTEASIARAEQERLMQLEKQRLARMHAVTEEDEDPAPAPSRSRGGDDLDDDFSRQWLPQDDDSDDDSEEDDEEGEEDDEEEDDEYDLSGSGSDIEGSNDEEDYESKPSKRAKLEEDDEEASKTPLNDQIEFAPDDELPFTLAMPSDYKSFSTLISNQSPKRQAIIISRLRACHHISLHPVNRSKLGQLVTYLYKRISDVGLLWLEQLESLNNVKETPTSEASEKSKPKSWVPKSEVTMNDKEYENDVFNRLLNYLEVLVKPIFDLSTQLPDVALKSAKEELLRLEQAHLKNLTDASEEPGKSVVPSFPTLCYVQLMSIVFSVSDRRHAVISPLVIHTLHVLGTCRMQNAADVQRSVFLAHETLAFLKPAKRFAGEPFSLLFFILHSFLLQNNLTPKPSLLAQFNPILYIQPKSLEITNKSTCKEAQLKGQTSLSSLVPSIDTTSSSNSNSKSNLTKSKKKDQQVNKDTDANGISSAKDLAIIQAIHSTLVVLQAYLQMHTSEVAAVELFAQTHRLLSALHDSYLPEATAKLRSSMIAMCDRVQKAMGQVRLPIQQFIKVVQALPALTPDFDDSYFGEKMTVDKVAKETQRMKRKIKSEHKGAEKELRKDTRFIQQLKLKQRGDKLAERKKTNNSTLAMLEQQQSEMNKKALSRKKK
jgi:nucleolar protein 14